MSFEPSLLLVVLGVGLLVYGAYLAGKARQNAFLTELYAHALVRTLAYLQVAKPTQDSFLLLYKYAWLESYREITRKVTLPLNAHIASYLTHETSKKKD